MNDFLRIGGLFINLNHVRSMEVRDGKELGELSLTIEYHSGGSATHTITNDKPMSCSDLRAGFQSAIQTLTDSDCENIDDHMDLED